MPVPPVILDGATHGYQVWEQFDGAIRSWRNRRKKCQFLRIHEVKAKLRQWLLAQGRSRSISPTGTEYRCCKYKGGLSGRRYH